ncbi:hypothetical protein [Williamsia phyllosphaerae]|uniref:Excreted virulence factor EspC (Type VII ESX diderm) n=1 Tax=Williamsia phyllosphaerae TaxID=885042 RepID=A0ABQ1U5N9_9NOCA|nr:hypothetical protein [Williamsia phyllosphaerae]GGF10991.1 hypothetical protein GCM10007298_03690 [Williamsia phyllosphaerae]
MQIDKTRVHAIAKDWEECHAALIDASTTAGDASGDWAPGVRGAVTSFTSAWRADLAQLAAEADAISRGMNAAAASYAITDEEAAERMRQVQKAIAPPA